MFESVSTTNSEYIFITGLLRHLRSGKTHYHVINHSPADIRDWARTLRKGLKGQMVAVAVELKNGPLVSALLEFDFITIIPVAPNALAKYRETFCQSGAKDDPSDAYLIVDFVYRHHEKLSVLEPDTPETRQLQKLVEQRRVLVQERVRVTNRLQQSVREYYPQVLDWFDDIDTVLFCDFLERWPSLELAKKARKFILERFFVNHNCRYKATIQKRITAIRQSISLTNDTTTIAIFSRYACVQTILLRNLLAAIKDYDQQIAASFKAHEDYIIFDSLPGAGPVYGPRLLAAMGSRRNRYQSSEQVSVLAGISPVLERSGKSTWIHWRYSCPTFVRQTFVEWAYHSTKYSYWAQRYYECQKAKGKSHQTILRALAFKWIRIIFRCWSDKTPYDETQYLLALKQRGSSLLN